MPFHTPINDDRMPLLAEHARFRAAATIPKLGFSFEEKAGLEASYRIAYRIATEKKPHTIGGRLMNMNMVELLCDGVEQKK